MAIPSPYCATRRAGYLERVSGKARADHRHTVLLVEDDYGTREAFKAVGEIARVDVVDVPNGRAALERLRDGPRPCLIVLDIAMPEMDGFAFRRIQLADPLLADVPVVVTSGAGWAVEREARALGIKSFLRKPVEVDALIALFHDHCGGDRPSER